MSNTFDSKTFLASQGAKPGVYQMFNEEGKLLYVGKAKHLKNRLSSYFQKNLTSKTAALMKQVVDIQVIVTASETEALILENNIIKAHHPRYNILFRDDKSYPYIYAATKQDYPRLDFYRGARSLPGKYFGPYPSVQAVRSTLNLLQKIFLLRSCKDTFFRNRSRPCLQYQIKRCSGPCVGCISKDDYQKDFANAMDVLGGKSEKVLSDLESRMEKASSDLEFEQAAKYRDQIAHLREIQAQQYAIKGKRNIDVIAIAENAGAACVYLLLIRDGQILGNKTYFSKIRLGESLDEILSSFVTRHYMSSEPGLLPDVVLTKSALIDEEILQAAMKQEQDHQLIFQQASRGDSVRWMQMAERSATQALATYITAKSNIQNKFNDLNDRMNFDSTIERIECFDISHTGGEATVASCVVFDLNGAVKSDYRHFNIEGVKAADDYAAMKQVLMRRYTKLKKTEAKLPDLLLIDGGKGQLRQAEEVLEELQISGLNILGIAKGKARKDGLETLVLGADKGSTYLPPDSLALHLLQQVRDEAHRFAITHNRQRVGKARQTSTLENIEGVGPKRRKALLKYFGGLQSVSQASVDQLASVEGINRELAQRIYDALH